MGMHLVNLLDFNSAIHKTTGLTVLSHSMILTGTIPVEQKKCPLAVNGSCWKEWPLGGVPAGVFFENGPVTKEPAAL